MWTVEGGDSGRNGETEGVVCRREEWRWEREGKRKVAELIREGNGGER